MQFAATVIRSLRRGGARHFGDSTTRSTIERAAELLPWFVFPNGKLARLGDTSHNTLNPPTKVITGDRSIMPVQLEGCVEKSVVVDLSRSGYVVVRSHPEQPIESQRAMLIFTGMCYSRVHKHVDDLSFELFENGRMILVDAGKYSYEQDDIREYVVSALAHNTIALEEVPIGVAQMSPYGSALCRPEPRGAWIELSGSVDRPDLFRQSRSILYRPGSFLVVRDRMESFCERTFVSSLHLAHDLRPVLGERRASIESGGCAIGFAVVEDRAQLVLEHEYTTIGYRKVARNSVLRAKITCTEGVLTWVVLMDPSSAGLARRAIESLSGGGSSAGAQARVGNRAQ